MISKGHMHGIVYRMLDQYRDISHHRCKYSRTMVLDTMCYSCSLSRRATAVIKVVTTALYPMLAYLELAV